MGRYIGIDLGGTNIKCGAVDDAGRVVHRLSVPTDSDRGAEAVLNAMIAGAKDAAAGADWSMASVDAIGIGSPGPIDFAAGVIVKAPNIPGLDNMPLRDGVSAGTGRPSILENDANAAAFAEYWVGAAKDPSVDNIVMLTLGTGIGSGIIVNGALIHGAHNSAGEGGHMIVKDGGRQCGCGQRGCLEAYASASHTANRAREALDNGGASTLNDLPAPITSEQVFAAAAAGDKLALGIIDETTDLLGVACVNLCRLLDPQMILFAGGMIHAGDFLFDRIRAAFARHTWTVAEDRVQIGPAMVGNDAGLIGAAGVARDAHRQGRL